MILTQERLKKVLHYDPKTGIWIHLIQKGPKSIRGFKGLYEVSDTGRVRSLPRKGSDGRSLGSVMLSVRGTGPDGRPRVCLYNKKNKRVWKLVYRLVLEAFVGPCPKGMEACHYPDFTVTNCKLKNLRWGTRQDNVDHMVEHGRVNPNRTKDGRFTSYESRA